MSPPPAAEWWWSPGGGVRIEVTAGFDGATLKRVLAILGAGA